MPMAPNRRLIDKEHEVSITAGLSAASELSPGDPSNEDRRMSSGGPPAVMTRKTARCVIDADGFACRNCL